MNNEQTHNQKTLNLDVISQQLLDKICAINFDLDAIGKLLKLICQVLEEIDSNFIHIKTKHRVCQSLSICYFCLLEYEDGNFPEVLSYVRISLTCMSLLKQSVIASHIMCRALLERTVVYGRLFNKDIDLDSLEEHLSCQKWSGDDIIKLSEENLKFNYGNRFRRLPNFERRFEYNRKKIVVNENHNSGTPDDRIEDDQPDKQSINSYLLIEAFKSSINNMEDFANLFVEFHCPVTFDKLAWSSDETVRVINEKNLSLLKKFNQIPPLWDLFELIGQAGCLKFCLSLIKGLLAAHLALWASATTDSSPNKMLSTSRLIPPLAQSDLVPKEFAFTIEVFPHLAPIEVYSVLNDIWNYLKDTNLNTNLTPEEKFKKAKTCLDRLRIFMCHNTPGPLFVKIFQNYFTPESSDKQSL